MNTNKHESVDMKKLLDGVKVEWKALGEVFEMRAGQHISASKIMPDKSGVYPYPCFGGNGVRGFVEVKSNDGAHILIGRQGALCGNVQRTKGRFYATEHAVVVTANDEVNIDWAFHLLTMMNLNQYASKSAQPGLAVGNLQALEIPIPPLHVQKEIVRILDTFTELTTELTHREKQYNHYRDQLLSFEEGDVEWKTLGELFEISAGGDVPKDAFFKLKTAEFNIPILSNGIGDKALYGWTNKAKIQNPSLTISARGTIGWTSYRTAPFFPVIRLLAITPRVELNLKYCYYFMKTIENDYNVSKSGIPQLTKPMIEGTKIPIPYPKDPEKSLAEQARIVAILDKFDTLTHSINEGLPREIELRQKQYEHYRNLLLSFRMNQPQKAQKTQK